jgi:hypothetical protein
MGLMNFVTSEQSLWMHNPIKKIVDKNSVLDIKEEEIIVQSFPVGKPIEIVYSINDIFSYSLDSIKAGVNNSIIGEYLKKYVYDKLLLIVKALHYQRIHFYGYVGKTGLVGTDIYVNGNWLNWSLSGELFKNSKIKIPEIIYTGTLNRFDFSISNNFIIRTIYEPLVGRKIYYCKLS